jgi:hypothetical protein
MKAAAHAAATWTLTLEDASERRRLLDGHRSRRVELEHGGIVSTDYTAADEWLISQHAAAGRSH